MADYLSALAAVCEAAPRINIPPSTAAPGSAHQLAHFAAETPSPYLTGRPYPPRLFVPTYAEARPYSPSLVYDPTSLAAFTSTPSPQQRCASPLQYLSVPTYHSSQVQPDSVSPEAISTSLALHVRGYSSASPLPYCSAPTLFGFPPLGGCYPPRSSTPPELLPPTSAYPLTPPPTPKSPPAFRSARFGTGAGSNPVTLDPLAHERFERFLEETWPTVAVRRGVNVVRAALYARIANSLRGSEEAPARFRQWVKKSEFFLLERTQPDGSYGACLAVPSGRRTRKAPDGAAAVKAPHQSARLVARVEDFVHIIGAYHNDIKGHHGIRKTYGMVQEDFSHVPRTAVAKFIELCAICMAHRSKTALTATHPATREQCDSYARKTGRGGPEGAVGCSGLCGTKDSCSCSPSKGGAPVVGKDSSHNRSNKENCRP